MKQKMNTDKKSDPHHMQIPNGGKMGVLIRSFDWVKTPLGPIESWPQSLLTAVNIVLESPVPLVMLWGQDGIMIYNDAYSLFAGARHPSLLGSKVLEGWPEVADFNKNVMEKGLKGEKLSYKDQRLILYRNNRPEDVYMNLNYSPIINELGEAAGVLAIVVETTERVLAEEELLASEARLGFMADAMPQQVWTATPDGALDYVNEYASKYFDKSAAQIVGQGWKDVVHPDDLEECVKLWTESVKTGKPYQVFFRLRKSDGSYRWHLGRALPLVDKDTILKWFGTNTDIDDQKKMEKQKDDFIRIASHELKTPVTSIKAYAQVLEVMFRRKGDLKSAEKLAKLDTQVDKLTNLIADLLDVSKMQSGQMQFHESDFDINELIAETVEEVQRTSESHTIILKLGPTSQLFGDRERIGQVVTNLITNAIKYSPNADKIVVHSTVDDTSVKVSVKDYGVGIPKDKQGKVFEQFYRVSGNKQHIFPGLGLGLYISSEIIKREGGRIWVESEGHDVAEEKRGSTFYFSLPITKKQKKRVAIK